MNLEGKVALVTGGSRGIGRAITLMLAEKGCNVSINYVSHREEAKTILSLVRQKGVEGMIVRADVSRFDEVRSMVDKTTAKFGRIDALINNAAVSGTNKLVNEIDEGEWNRVIDINLKGAFHCCKAVVPYMLKEKRGKIVNITSLGGKGGITSPDYGASKAGMIGLTFGLANQLAKYNILTNAVAPGGTIDTDMTRSTPEDLRKRIADLTLVGRPGKPEEIAHAVIFVLENDYVLGEVVDVNGGRYFD
jgi:3-oxoacyl-[acyl-carrier protein] reductase